MKKTLFLLALLAIVSAGCLEKETTQAIYIESDGSVTWEVLESDVYSSASKPLDREREEAEYLALARSGRPEIAQAFAELGGTEVQVQLLRDRRPFRLRVTARFRDLEHALSGLFTAAEIDAQVTLERVDGKNFLTITPLDLESKINTEDSEPVLELMRAEELRFVLSAGSFESAEGFSLESGSRIAVLDGESEEEAGPIERYRLVWGAKP